MGYMIVILIVGIAFYYFSRLGNYQGVIPPNQYAWFEANWIQLPPGFRIRKLNIPYSSLRSMEKQWENSNMDIV